MIDVGWSRNALDSNNWWQTSKDIEGCEINISLSLGETSFSLVALDENQPGAPSQTIMVVSTFVQHLLPLEHNQRTV